MEKSKRTSRKSVNGKPLDILAAFYFCKGVQSGDSNSRYTSVSFEEGDMKRSNTKS